MNILPLDLATQVGCADGAPGSRPRLWTWCLSDAGEDRPQRLAYLQRFLTAYFDQFKTDEVVFELPLNIATIAGMFAKRIFVTNENALALLRGAIGVAEATAACAGVPVVRGIDVKQARLHLVGQRSAKGEGKDAAFRACHALGWDPQNQDESDAGALWSLACGQSNPRLAAALGRAHLAAKEPLPVRRRTARLKTRATLFD